MANPPAASNCDACDGACCKYVTVQIATPRRPIDFDELRWFFAHDGLEVFIDDGAWFLRINRPCRHLDPGGRCSVYDRRFLLCRMHDAATCERSARQMPDTLFRTRDEFEAWFKDHGTRRKTVLRGGQRRPT